MLGWGVAHHAAALSPHASSFVGVSYLEAQRVTSDFFGLEAALLVFMQSLIEGAEGGAEEVALAVTAAIFGTGPGRDLEQNTDASTTGPSSSSSLTSALSEDCEPPLVSVALNWMGISMRQVLAASVKSFFNALETAAVSASVGHDMSLSYYILLESMCDVGIMPPSAEKRWGALSRRRFKIPKSTPFVSYRCLIAQRLAGTETR
jgi:hypothetical protein